MTEVRDDKDFVVLGIVVTFVLHLLVFGGFALASHLDGKHTERKATLAEEKYETIEAGLAVKSKSTNKKKSKLPQKDVAEKVKPPTAPGVATDPNAAPSKDKDKPEEYIPPDKQDPASVFDKFRNVDTGHQASVDGAGEEQENVQGDPEGHEFGTLDKAKGDPYVGELIGRMIKDFTVPSVVTETGLETWGCVKLEEDGKVKDWKIDPEHKSGSHAFNSAVEDRLKQTTDMEEPVPDHLKRLLVEQYACVKFKF